MSVICPDWCTQEHGFVDTHDGHGYGERDDICIFVTAEFGEDWVPRVDVMLGDPKPGGFYAKVTPQAARDLLQILEDTEAIKATVAALKAVLEEIER